MARRSAARNVGSGRSRYASSHDLLVLESEPELVPALEPFVRAGIEAGDLVLLHGRDGQAELLQQAFGGLPGVRVEPAPEHFPGLMQTLARYQRLCHRENAAGRRVRISGQPPVLADDRATVEWLRCEALVERALAPYRYSGLCRYDIRRTPVDVLAIAVDSHQRVVSARPRPRLAPAVASGTYVATDVGALHAARPVVQLPDCRTTAEARHAVQTAMTGRGTADVAVIDFVRAVSEVVSNALRHGASPVRLDLRTDGRRWLCVVTDCGPGIVDPWTGIDSPLGGGVGAGLWTARQLCADLTINCRPGSTRVSLFAR